MNKIFVQGSPWRRGVRHTALCAVMLCAASVSVLAADAAPGQPVTLGNVQVSYSDPTKFSEMDRNPNERTAWLDQLSRYVAKRASRTLPSGERLSVTITDVQLAGEFEPWRRGDLAHVRFMRDLTPPRIDLRFRLESADGAVLKEGERKLRDLDYLNHSPARPDQPLGHEMNLIDSWTDREFARAAQ